MITIVGVVTVAAAVLAWNNLKIRISLRPVLFGAGSMKTLLTSWCVNQWGAGQYVDFPTFWSCEVDSSVIPNAVTGETGMRRS